MKRQLRSSASHSSARTIAGRFAWLAAFLSVSLGAPVAMAQAADPEVGGTPEGYQPEKTIEDYTGTEQERPDADFDYASNTLRVEVWTDKERDDIYRKGEEIGVAFETNRDAYAVVYRIDAEGFVSVLWPRTRFDDGFVFGGHEYQLPVTGAQELRVTTVEGQGIVEAVVSQYPFDLRALEIDFHHEQKAERYAFRVAGDPFLAINEVNYAVTGLEDAGEYVVSNYASYYVHQNVDHPRYLCGQCHNQDELAYDPYRDECTLTIEYDYSWYNGWYDNYGYYPVYGNPVYVYIDPWTWSPWVNYWYYPSYTCAPWYGWGWGWGACYSWSYSPYYWGNCATVYSSGYRRYSPLDRTRSGAHDGVARKTREYNRGSSMVRSRAAPEGKREQMASRTRSSEARAGAVSVADRGGTTTRDYRGESPKVRSRQSFEQVAGSTGRGGLRIRENVRATGGRPLTGSQRRHTAAGQGRQPGLVPVGDEDAWRGTTRVGGRSSRGAGMSSVGTSRGTSGVGGAAVGGQDSRTRTSSGSKSVRPRTRSTRVWNATGSRSETSRSRAGGTRDRSGSVERSRGGADRGTSVTPRSSRSNSSSRKSSGTNVRSNSGSRSRSSSGASRGSGGGSRGGGSRSSGSRSSSGRR